MGSGDIVGTTTFHSNSGDEPQSPLTGGSANASPRRSSSPNEHSPGRPHTRKRTNTTSSGSGDKRTANKICRVCGDKAFSYNFNVITCESCKAFFRRNANKEKDIRCPFSENCEINVVSRRFCQRCRLAKCFQVGMKKEWIMSEEARLEKKQRVEENRERRLLDAMRAEGDEEASSPRRERARTESKTEDVPSPSSVPMRMLDDEYSNQGVPPPLPPQPQYPPLPTTFGDVTAPPIMTQPSLANAIAPVLDPIPTTAAHSLADVSSTTSAIQPMDVDPSSTMSGLGFIPPVVECSAPSTMTNLLPVVSVTNAVESSIMAAQAQLAVQAVAQAQQVQAAQQIAAAVVAHQVAQQIGAVAPPPPMAPQMPQTLTTAIQAPIATAMQPMQQSLQPTMQQTLQPPLQPMQPMQQMQPNILAPMPQPPNPFSMDMVTIPREMLVQLIENNTKRAASCTCKCMCGRYPHGATIVDEVTKDLLAAGSQANCNSCEQKEEARLETAEDFQRNGLLPSEDSSVQWLNSSQATVVDPSTLSDNPYPAAVDPFNQGGDNNNTCQGGEDPEFSTLSVYDRDVLNEVEAANKEWGHRNGRIENGNRYKYLRQDPSCYESSVQARVETTVRELLSASKKVCCFRAIPRRDQIALIRDRSLAYLIMRGVQLYDSMNNQWVDPETWPVPYDFQKECSLIYSQLNDVKGSDEIVAVLSLLCLFDYEARVYSKEDVLREHNNLVGLLKRLLYSLFHKNEQRAREECARLLHLLPQLRDLASRCGHVFQCDAGRIDAILAEAQ